MIPDPLPPLSRRDQDVYDAIVPQSHYLRLARANIDFERFRPILDNAYSADMGRPSVDPVRMLKFEFLRFHYGLSDRQAMERAKTDVAFRWFLDLSIGEDVPDHTNGTHFRQRIGVERFKDIFQDLVRQAREHGLVRDRLRLKDSTHTLAAVADVWPLRLVAQVRDLLLRAAAALFPEWVAEQRGRVEHLRQATAEWKDADRLTARLEHLHEMRDALRGLMADLPATSTPDPKRQRLDDMLAVVDKLFADRANPKAGDRLASGVDADARVGKHGGFHVGFSFDVLVDADSEIVTNVNVLPANGAEAADAIRLVKEEEEAQGNDVAGLSMDGAGYNGPVLRELTDPSGLALDVTVPPPPTPERKTFGPERFQLHVCDDGARELTCPHGQTTRQRERNDKDTADKYIFSAGKCRACPLRSECLQNPHSAKGRTVVKNDYEAEYQKLRARVGTPEYKATRSEHAKVERKLGELVRHHGARRARYRGQPKVLIQMLLTTLVVNVKRMVKLLTEAAKPPPTASTCAKWAPS